MTDVRTSGITKTLSLAALTLVLLAGATAADAQDREGRWEFTLGTFYQLGIALDGEEESTLDTDDDFGFAIGGGYNFSERLATSFALQWAEVGYDADIVEEDGGVVGINGSYDAFALAVNGIFNLTEGPLTPYVGAGIGWTWVDSNIPDGLPSTGCWWDPWWGYVCYTTYPTKTESAFSYQAVAGIRYDFDSTFIRLNYTCQWLDFGSFDSTPRFDVIGLDFGWMF
jgi:opacity protein-like surface antigen